MSKAAMDTAQPVLCQSTRISTEQIQAKFYVYPSTRAISLMFDRFFCVFCCAVGSNDAAFYKLFAASRRCSQRRAKSQDDPAVRWRMNQSRQIREGSALQFISNQATFTGTERPDVLFGYSRRFDYTAVLFAQPTGVQPARVAEAVCHSFDAAYTLARAICLGINSELTGVVT